MIQYLQYAIETLYALVKLPKGWFKKLKYNINKSDVLLL